ncbi:MAG: DUF4410 domain-containing protein [Gammaproteobacteria bacterium]|nr:DUF4410 domain-containing protein [Gammaproteobacteria bacterium]
MNIVKKLLVATCIAMLAACSTSVKRLDDGNGETRAIQSQSIAEYNIHLTENAQQDQLNNREFREEELKRAISDVMRKNNLGSNEKNGKTLVLDVQVTNIRVRSSFAAIMFGFLAGSDYIRGEVTLKDQTGKQYGQFLVSADYAFGGFAGGQNDVRMNWLYEAFAESLAKALLKA